MTLSERNIFFKAGIILSVICMVISIAGSLKAIPVYGSVEGEISCRSEGIFQAIAGKNMDARLMAVHIGILMLALYSFLSMVLIYYYFEKTQSPEILFIVFFAASFSMEVFRLSIPLGYVYELPSLYLILSSRIVLAGRFFGLFSLFTASVFAVGFEAQRSNVILIIVMVTLIMALGVPIDTQVWDSSLNMVNGFNSMFKLIEAGIFLITVISFLIAAWRRGSREFAFIGIGAALVFLGRNILLNADTWPGLPAGLIFLVAGTWLICNRLHKVYLWL